MKEIKIANARITLRDGKEYVILTPRIKINNGEIRVTGMFEKSAFSDLKDFEIKLGMKEGRHVITEADLFRIKGDDVSDKKIEITKLNFENVWYDELRFRMYSYGEVIETRPSDNNTNDELLSISIDGVDMIHDGISKVRVERHLNGIDYSYVKKYKNDFTDSALEFSINQQKYNFKFSIVRLRKDDYSCLFFTDKVKPSLAVYLLIKESLRAFLSFAFENTVLFREEHFSEGKLDVVKTFSNKIPLKNHRTKFIPVNNSRFRRTFIKYMPSFERFVLVDQELNLKDMIYLINQAKKATVENGTFLLIIIIEQIAFRYSELIDNVNVILPMDAFDKLFAVVIETFEKEFHEIRNSQKNIYDHIFSKLKNINHTNQKISFLLEYCEIKLTEELKGLSPKFRNFAIHRGDIEYPEGSGFDNYKNLLYLCNTIIANLIQYKGIRYIDHIGTDIFIEEKKEYKSDSQK